MPSTEVVDQGDVENVPKKAIHLSIPPRFYLVPGMAVIVGSVIGIVRGSRRASLRFLAENVHRPPTTVQGWYFYNKTKNYKVMLGAIKGAAAEASKLTLVALGWVGIEDGLTRIGWAELREIGAALGTAGMFSMVYRLPWKTARQTIVLGLIIGSSLEMLRWGEEKLKAQEVALRATEKGDHNGA